MFSSGSSHTAISTETLATDLTILEDWDLSIDLKLPAQSTALWKNVFGIQVEGIENDLPGSRIPSVWIRKDLVDVMLRVDYVTVDFYHVATKFNTGNWINLKISQTGGICSIKVDSQLVHQEINSSPKIWTNVKIVMGNVYGQDDFSPADGEYRNFEINNFPLTSKSLR